MLCVAVNCMLIVSSSMFRAIVSVHTLERTIFDVYVVFEFLSCDMLSSFFSLVFTANSWNYCYCFQTGGQLPDMLSINCSYLSKTSEIFIKVKMNHDIDVDMFRFRSDQLYA